MGVDLFTVCWAYSDKFSPFLPFPSFLRSLPFLLLPSLTSRPREIQLEGLGSAVSSPSGVWGMQSPSRNRIWFILALKYDIRWHIINDFPESRLTKFWPVETNSTSRLKNKNVAWMKSLCKLLPLFLKKCVRGHRDSVPRSKY